MRASTLTRLICAVMSILMLIPLPSCKKEEPPKEEEAKIQITEDIAVIYEDGADKSASRIRTALKDLISKTPDAHKAGEEHKEYKLEIHLGETDLSETKNFANSLGELEYGVKILHTQDKTKILIGAQSSNCIGLAANMFIDEYLPKDGQTVLQKTEDTITKAPEGSVENLNFAGLSFEENVIKVTDTRGQCYTRMAKLADGRIICTYGSAKDGDSTSQIYATFSSDQGLTWSESVPVTGGIDGDVLICANGVPYQLSDGTIIVGYRANEKKTVGMKEYHSSIRVMQSKDGGKSWERHSIVWDLYETNINYANSFGLWEPHFGLLNGELACFFAIGKNVYDYNHIINSTDIFVYRGNTWVRADYTSTEVPGSVKNGMPVWQAISEGGYFMAVESTKNQKLPTNNTLTTKLLTSRDGIHWVNQCDVYIPSKYKARSAAPYIVQLPDGRFVVSYMTDEDLTQDSANDQMILKISVSKPGKNAYELSTVRDFEGPFNVFGTPVGNRSVYGGMMVDEDYLYVYSYTDYPSSRIVLRRAKLK